MKPGLRNGLIIASILGLTLLAALTVAHRQRLTQLSPAPSTFNASPCGLKAAYAMLERLHRPAERWQHPWTKLTGRSRLLIYAEASPFEYFSVPRAIPPTKEECDALARWIARGNALLLYANPDTDFRSELAPLLMKLGFFEASTNHVHRADHRPSSDEFFERPSRESLTLPSVMPTTFTRGVRQLQVARNSGLRPERGAYVPLAAGEDRNVQALWLSHDRGQVLMFSSASFIDNEFIKQQDNLALLISALREFAGDDAILFDEYHHGYSQEFAMHDFLRLPIVKFAAAQLGLLVGLLIWSQWRRFGEPISLAHDTRRSVMEYAVSLGDLYARAETQLETLEYLFGNLRREMIDRHGLRAGATVAEIGARLDGAPRQSWEALAADCERHLQSRALTRLQFARLARHIQEFRRQLR